MTEDTEALAKVWPDLVPYDAQARAEAVLASDWLADRDARLLAEGQATGSRRQHERAKAAEADLARLRHDIEAAIETIERQSRTCKFEHAATLRAVLAAERDPEAGEGRG